MGMPIAYSKRASLGCPRECISTPYLFPNIYFFSVPVRLISSLYCG